MTINQEWIDWINLNISRGCDKEGIYKILIDEGFDPSDIEKQMGYQPEVDIDDIPIYTSVGFKKEKLNAKLFTKIKVFSYQPRESASKQVG